MNFPLMFLYTTLLIVGCNLDNNKSGTSLKIKTIETKSYHYNLSPESMQYIRTDFKEYDRIYNLLPEGVQYIWSDFEEYDRLGNIKQGIYVEDHKKGKQIFYYDSQNRKSQIYYLNQDSTVNYIEKISYYKNDSVNKKIYIDSKGKTIASRSNIYSDNFKIKKTIFKHSNKKIGSVDSIVYNNQCQTIFEKSIAKDKELSYTSQTEYFSNCKKEKRYNYKNAVIYIRHCYNTNDSKIERYFDYPNRLSSQITRKYDSNGNQIYFLYTDFETKDNDLYLSKFDKNNNELESTWLSFEIGKKPTGVMKSVIKYDKHNNKIKKEVFYYETKNLEKYTYKYKYDNKGNWIEKIDSEYKTRSSRKITYY